MTRTTLITGGNSGIGWETAAALGALGDRVVFTTRDATKAQDALARLRARVPNGDFEAMSLDLANFASIRAFAAEFLAREPRLDVLINNAGGTHSKRTTTVDGFETTFGVNHLGHFLLTDLLLERLQASAPSRVVVVASEAHRMGGPMHFDDLETEHRYIGFFVYARSKLANVLFAKELARRLAGTGVTANSVHPGLVATSFGNNRDANVAFKTLIRLSRPLMVTAEKGAETSVYLAASPDVEGISGHYWSGSSMAKESRHANAEAATRLWAASVALVESVPAP